MVGAVRVGIVKCCDVFCFSCVHISVVIFLSNAVKLKGISEHVRDNNNNLLRQCEWSVSILLLKCLSSARKEERR